MLCNYTAVQLEQLTTGENEKMLFNKSNGNQNKKRGGLDFLEDSHLSTTPTEVKVMGVKEADGQYGKGVVLKLALGGKQVKWTVRERNPNFNVLIQKFGYNENDWMGAKFFLHLDNDNFDETYYPKVTFGPTTKGGK